MLKINVVFLLALLTCGKGASQESSVVVTIPDADSESEYVWRTLQDLRFFDENNYQVNLPRGAFIDSLRGKAKSAQLTEEDYRGLFRYMKDSVYQRSDYAQGYRKIEQQLPLINKMITELRSAPRNWDFKQFDTYQVNLTLYGPGGSYNPNEGAILIYTTPNGSFKQYVNPANTIIHEITHIGIEEGLVNKFQIPHPLKERIVDMFVSLHFKEYLPDYQIQNMGDERIDSYLKSKDDLKNLDTFVKQILEESGE